MTSTPFWLVNIFWFSSLVQKTNCLCVVDLSQLKQAYDLSFMYYGKRFCYILNDTVWENSCLESPTISNFFSLAVMNNDVVLQYAGKCYLRCQLAFCTIRLSFDHYTRRLGAI